MRGRGSGSPAVLAVAGAATIGVAFGMARYGYGLLLPDMRAALHLSSATIGTIAAGSYVAYLLATVLAGAVARRAGPRAMVLAAGALGAIGMVLIARAQTPVGLATGVFVAGGAAGLAFPPFSDVVAAVVPTSHRARTFAIISSGTGAGVAIAAPVAILAGASWRTAWLAFAALAVGVTVAVTLVLPRRDALGSAGVSREPLRLRWFVCPRSRPLLVGALIVALAASVWWTFAVDLASSTGGLSRTQARTLQATVGVASLAGGFAGDVVRRAGARRTYRTVTLVLAAALVALALAPASLAAALLAGVAFGGAYNLLLAIQAMWSARVFADRPSTGLAAVLTMSGIGLLVGPLVAGPLADHTSLPTAFLAAAALGTCATLFAPSDDID